MGGKETRQLQAEGEKKVNCQTLEGKERQTTITRLLSEQIYGLVEAFHRLILQTLIFLHQPVV